jgi:hypothetical protein
MADIEKGMWIGDEPDSGSSKGMFASIGSVTFCVSERLLVDESLSVVSFEEVTFGLNYDDLRN